MMFLHIATFLLSISFAAEPSYYELGSKEFFALESVNSSIDLGQLDQKLLEASIFYASNEVRTEENKSEFNYHKVLHQAARLHADYLEERSIVDHFNRHNRKHRTPMDRVSSIDKDFMAVAENLARLPVYKLGTKGEFFMDGQGKLLDAHRRPLKASTYAELARQVVGGWMNSKGHRENLMGDFALLGVGVSHISYNKNGIPEIYLVQNFGNH